jgi:hypothetical protein
MVRSTEIVYHLLKYSSSDLHSSPWFLLGQVGGGVMKISTPIEVVGVRAKPATLGSPNTGKVGVGEDIPLSGIKSKPHRKERVKLTRGGPCLLQAPIHPLTRMWIPKLILVRRQLSLSKINRVK